MACVVRPRTSVTQPPGAPRERRGCWLDVFADVFLLRVSRVSHDEFRLQRPAVDRGFELLDRAAQADVACPSWMDELGQAGSDGPGVGMGEEEGRPEPEVGDAIAVAPGDALDEPMEPEPTEFVAEPALAELFGRQAEERRKIIRQVGGPEAVRLETEDDQCREQGLHPGVGEAERRGPLAADLAG